MSLDLCILSLVAFFAFLGAVTGAARQVAQWVALFVAFFVAKPLGAMLGPTLTQLLHAPKMVGAVAATVVVFFLALMLVRFVLTGVLRRILAGQSQERVSTDRALGFILGGGKIAAMAYVMLSAVVYAQQHVSVAGRHVSFAGPDSYCFRFVKTYNLFELTQFGAVRDLTRVGQALQHPEGAQRLLADPAYKALRADARFKEIMSAPAMRKALLANDYVTLLRNNTVFEFLQQDDTAARLHAAAQTGQGS